MTRINCGIPPKELSDRHLLAEHREIKRIPNNVSKNKCNLNNIPQTFTLGTGHVRFFYDKLLYLQKRYEEIWKECKLRMFNVTYYGNAWEGIDKALMNDYTPTQNDINLIKERIKEKNENSK